MGNGVGAVTADLVLVTAVFLVPAAAGLLFAVKLHVESRAAQCIFAVGTPCVAAYAASGFYLVSAPVGRVSEITAFVVVTGAGATIGARDPVRSLAALRWWAAPALMVVAASACVLGIGFLHGGTTFPLREAEIRFIHRLANDNVLPRAFAKQALAAQRPLPHVLSGTWLSSDRPPMETSLYLMVLAVLPTQDPSGLLFEALGTLLQSLWMPALWCLFTVVRLPRRMIAMGRVAVLLSGFTIFNSFYVWPKLFPAAFLVMLVTLVLTDEWSSARTRLTARGLLAVDFVALCLRLDPCLQDLPGCSTESPQGRP
ncbi:MAG: hypothetical protein ACLPQS_07620 [Acidimicrobiales bacterium]